MPVKKVSAEEVVPDGPEVVVFKARPGYRLAGQAKFPLKTSDQDLIKTIRKGRAYRGGVVWEETRSDDELKAAESALSGLSYDKLVSMARRLGVRFTAGMTKLDLLEQIEKEGSK